MKRLIDVETEEYSLEVYECQCGYCLGVDAVYQDQVELVDFECPACGEPIDTRWAEVPK